MLLCILKRELPPKFACCVLSLYSFQPFMRLDSTVKHLLTMLNSQLLPDDVYLLSRSFPGRMCIMRPCQTESKVSECLSTVTMNLSNPSPFTAWLACHICVHSHNKLVQPLTLYSLASLSYLCPQSQQTCPTPHPLQPG